MVRRVVTGHDANGKSVFASDEQVEPVTLQLFPGVEFHLLWGDDQMPSLPTDGTPAELARLLPPCGRLPLGILHPAPSVDRLGSRTSTSAPRSRRQARSCPASPRSWSPTTPACTPLTPSTSRSSSRVRWPWSSTTARGHPAAGRHGRPERHPPRLAQPRRHARSARRRDHRRPAALTAFQPSWTSETTAGRSSSPVLPAPATPMPPRGVKKGTKRARQYEHIKESTKERGASEDRAEEIAARTVNRNAPAPASRASARAPRRGHVGLAPRRPAFGHQPTAGRTRDQLYEEVKKLGVKGRSSMNKDQLQRAVDRKKSSLPRDS